MFRKVFFLACIIILISAGLNAQTIAQFRGLNRDGVYPEKNLLTVWPNEGPALLWSNNDVGDGYGLPAITSDRVYITGEIDSTAWLFAFDRKGKLLWKSDFGKEWVKTFPGSRSTPTVAGNLLYVCSGLGNITCFNAVDGSRKWSVNMLKDLNGRYIMPGHAESPLVHGKR